MKMDLILRQRLEQKLKLAPQIIQSIEILQLPALDLQDLITRELEENPVLEIEQPREPEEEYAPEPPSDAQLERKREQPDYEVVNELEESLLEDNFYTRRPRRADDDGHGKMEAMKNAESRPISLQDYLFQQLSLLELDPRIREIGEYIIYNINDDGYLQYSLEDILESIDLPVLFTMGEKALRAVQSLDPPGIGARDLKECLLLQLAENGHAASFEHELIENHLKDIELNRFPKIAKETGRSIDEVKECIRMISALNPRPGGLYAGASAPVVNPDVVVTCVDGEYEVRLEDDYLPRIYVNPSYHALLKEQKNNPRICEIVRKKLDSARWLIDAIEQRRTTLFKIAKKVIEIQRDFFDKGITHLKPLKMQEVAEAIGVHNSTVSRAISNKYAQTPRGIFPLKFFFTGGTTAEDGTVESRMSVKQRVKDIIDNEDKSNPLSDDEIAERLKEMGFNVARRTITKYRCTMRIPSSRRRKEY
ncbi:MAG: RNA polymerase sigma-54 factor [Planctomycetota bacterium]|nr:MAG: RNA polymerase sigma-54 factor [Planctomycetota bacterium]